MMYPNENQFEFLLGFEQSFLPARGSNIKIVAYIKENLSESEFRNAIKKLVQKHIFLRSRIALKNNNQYIFTTEGAVYPKVVIYRPNEKIDEETAIQNENLSLVNWETGATSRFILIQNHLKGDIIIVYLSHAISDGRAAAFILKHLLQFIANPELPIEPLDPVSMTFNAPLDAKIPGILKFATKIMNNKWAKQKRTFTPDEFVEVSQKRYLNGKDTFEIAQFTEDETKKLRENAHHMGISVNAVLLAAALIIKNQISSLSHLPNPVGFAIDIRDRLTKDAGEACCLAASATMIKPKYFKDILFWDLAKDIHIKSINALKSNSKLFLRRLMTPLMDFTLAQGMFMMQSGYWEGTPFLKRMAMKGKKIPACLILTNLGGLSIPKQFIGIKTISLDDAIFFPPLGSNQLIELGAASLAGKLTILTPSRSDIIDTQIRKDFMNKLYVLIKSVL